VDRLPGLAWLHLSESMSQFSSAISGQTDLALEGTHLQTFNSHFSSPQWRDISFPVPLVLSQSVLVPFFVFFFLFFPHLLRRWRASCPARV